VSTGLLALATIVLSPETTVAQATFDCGEDPLSVEVFEKA